LTGKAESPPPDCPKDGWYVQEVEDYIANDKMAAIRCLTGEKYQFIDTGLTDTVPTNIKFLKPLPRPGTDDPGPMEKNKK
jgi:hypothetical protein